VHTGRSWLRPPAAALTVARNWASSSGKLAVYSNSRSTTMHMYSGLAEVASHCFANGTIPESLKESITVALRKEGKKDYSLPGSYRLIALENTLAKVLEKHVANIMSEAAEEYGLLFWN